METRVTGSVRELCAAAAGACRALGYETTVLTASLCCEAREAGSFLASVAQYHADTVKPLAFIAGGETVVHITGTGLGGRNQELALSAAQRDCVDWWARPCFRSARTGRTVLPTRRAAWWTGRACGLSCRAGHYRIARRARSDNDAYQCACTGCDGLIKTGPTGTNVNDVSVLLLRPRA